MKDTKIYLDNSTTAAPSPAAVSAMMPYLNDRWGASSAPHAYGQRVFPAVEEAMRSVYSLLDAHDYDDLVITSSGAEAVNHVVAGVYHDITRAAGKNHFLVASTDEAPAIVATGRLEELGCVAKMIDVDGNGQVTVEALGEALTPRTALFSLSWGNGLTGVVHDIAPLAELCRDRGVLLHIDATHVLGKLYFDLEELQPDFITFNGEQLHAPPGSGVLYIKKGRSLSSFLLGGTEQAGLRAGNINIPALVGLGVAAEEALQARDYMCTEIARLRNKLEQGVISGFPDAKVFFCAQERVPHISAIGFPGVANEALLYALDREGVCASIGGGSLQQVGMNLSACAVNETLAHSAVAFSLSRYTKEEEVDKAIEVIVASAQRLAALSRGLFNKEAITS